MPSTPKVTIQSSPTPLWAIALVGVAFWLVGFWELHFEWAVSEQYNYGFFVPFLALYLFYLRWEDRPEPTKPSLSLPIGFLLSAATLVTYAVALLFLSNVDWRPLHFLQGFIAAGVCLMLLYDAGGWPWVRHFAFPILFLWVAIPWPRFSEKLLINGLMDIVASSTVDVLNLCGIYANQQGSAIVLSGGAVNVAEACSGVRSFQSTLMGGLFLGELFRLNAISRVLLIGLSCIFALLFNVIRTLGLTYLANVRGTDILHAWHDPAGYFIFCASFGLLFFFAFLFKRFSKEPKTRKTPHTALPLGLSTKVAFPIALLVALALPFSYGWYAYRSKDITPQPSWELDWQVVGPTLKLGPLDHAVEAVLVCDKSEKGEWDSPDGGSWVGYYMQWDSPETGQIGGLHSPGHCLPSVGWQLIHKGHPINWEKNGVKLVVCPFEFELYDKHIFVFDTQWDPSGYAYNETDGLRTYGDRFRDVWEGNRKNHKHTLEFVAEHYRNMNDAANTFLTFLDRALVVEKGESK